MRITMFKPLQRLGFIRDPFRSHYLGFRYMKNYIEHHEPDKHEFFFARWLDEVRTSAPDMLMISSVSEAWNDAVTTARWARKQGFKGPILFGGPHLTGLPESLPIEADCGVLGEGEIPALELVRAYEKDRRPDLSQIPGLVYWEGELKHTAPPPPLDLDEIPIDVERGADQRFDIATIRGCPFKCIHCVECRNQGKLRWLSADYLATIMELRYKKTGNPHFFFQDDTFLAAPHRLEELHARLAKRDMLGKFQINPISLNANLVKDHTIQLLKEIGAIRLGMGCESLNPRTLKRMKSGVVTLKHIEKTIALATKAGLPVGGSQVHGFPGETEEELLDSIRRVREYERGSNFRHCEVYVCQPFPGSRLWDAALTMGFVQPDMDFSTMRIDGDKQWFTSPWLYLNGHCVPKKRFVKILRDAKMQSRGKYLEV
jgi:anaerobic magnesium-protoporphyrin IX monomethyl ester cyclase